MNGFPCFGMRRSLVMAVAGGHEQLSERGRRKSLFSEEPEQKGKNKTHKDATAPFDASPISANGHRRIDAHCGVRTTPPGILNAYAWRHGMASGLSAGVSMTSELPSTRVFSAPGTPSIVTAALTGTLTSRRTSCFPGQPGVMA